MRAVPLSLLEAVVRSPHALELSCLTVAWDRMGRDEPWCRLSLATGSDISWAFWFEPKALEAHQIVPVCAWHCWRQL